ncbi:MAG: hypothetical protein GEU99_19285 [Luteitalea sp.]|nr:hypothetical protein [Luteitalea sp.]
MGLLRETRHARELAIVLVLYGLLAAGSSWPLLRDFSTRLVGDVPYDQRHTIWILWHIKEALLGRQPWLTADLLFYPHGVSTLIDGVGPISGLFALPFWPQGPVAAYNGATLVALALSGWCMYVLARYGRGLLSIVAGAPAPPSDPPALRSGRRAGSSRSGLHPTAAFFAGAVFMVWPIHLVALYGHLEKVFVGLLPLNVLAGLLAYDPARSPRWLCAPAVALLLILLHNGNQFTFALLALAALAALGLVLRRGETRRPFLVRVLASGAIALAVTAPLLMKLAHVARDPAMSVTLGDQSSHYAPDLLQFFVPSIHQTTTGRLFYPHYDTVLLDFTRQSVIPVLSPRADWYGSGIETAVTIPITMLVLASLAWFGSRRATVAWLLFGGAFVVLAMGPSLRVAGWDTIPLPYAWLSRVPGFDVMRTPGRFMMMASVGLAIVAALGLARLMDRTPRRAHLVAPLLTVLVLLECWPRPWPQQVLPPVPTFYTRLAQDPGRYAVLDLPSGFGSPNHASAYQYYQLTHRKPIAWGYLSRPFVRYPIDGLRGILDEHAPDAIDTREHLARLGYRFVVWHKRHAELFGSRRPEQVGDGRFREPPAAALSNAFLRQAFKGESPIVDDDLVTVYRIAHGF